MALELLAHDWLRKFQNVGMDSALMQVRPIPRAGLCLGAASSHVLYAQADPLLQSTHLDVLKPL